MDTLILAIFLLNNIIWMFFLYLMIPATSDKKKIELKFPNILGKDSDKGDTYSDPYQDLSEVSFDKVTKSFEKQRK